MSTIDITFKVSGNNKTVEVDTDATISDAYERAYDRAPSKIQFTAKIDGSTTVLDLHEAIEDMFDDEVPETLRVHVSPAPEAAKGAR